MWLEANSDVHIFHSVSLTSVLILLGEGSSLSPQRDLQGNIRDTSQDFCFLSAGRRSSSSACSNSVFIKKRRPGNFHTNSGLRQNADRTHIGVTLLLAGAVGVFVGDLSGNLAGESEQFISTCQQSHVPHAELSRRLVHCQLKQ